MTILPGFFFCDKTYLNNINGFLFIRAVSTESIPSSVAKLQNTFKIFVEASLPELYQYWAYKNHTECVLSVWKSSKLEVSTYPDNLLQGFISYNQSKNSPCGSRIKYKIRWLSRGRWLCKMRR